MRHEAFELQKDGITLRGSIWSPGYSDGLANASLRGRVLIVHGMGEHHARYEHFAQTLTSASYEVWGYDHRGHGTTAGDPASPEFLANYGFLAKKNGWRLISSDLCAVVDLLRARQAKQTELNLLGSQDFELSGSRTLPFFIFAHSMGSFLLRWSLVYDRLYGKDLSGVVISGTGGNPGFKGRLGRALAKLMTIIRGPRDKSPLMNAVIFGSYNRLVLGNHSRTDFDWLSHDEDQVNEYLRDPYCGGVMAASFYQDLMTGIVDLGRRESVTRFPRNLPCLFIAGREDPVGEFGVGVEQVFRSYQANGIKDIEVQWFEKGRHELLNETFRNQTEAVVLGWLLRKTEASRAES